VIIALLAKRKGIGLRGPLMIGMLLQSIALLIVGLPSVVALFPAVLILGFGGELLNVSFDSLMQRFVPLGSLGTARGLFDALATLVIPLSQLTFAWLVERGTWLNLPVGAFLLGVLALGILALTTRGLPLD